MCPFVGFSGTTLVGTEKIHIWSLHAEGSIKILDVGCGEWQHIPGTSQSCQLRGPQRSLELRACFRKRDIINPHKTFFKKAGLQ